MGKSYLFLTLAALLSYASFSQKILFDNTKAESAGNADWVIDADVHNLSFSGGSVSTSGSQSNAQRYPSPAQSGVTPSTSESYWQGAISSWAIECAKSGYAVESLPWNVAITYGNTSNPQDLSHYNVYVVDEPNTPFTSTEKTAILNFVANGGGLFMVSDHTGSDRNNDGYDSPEVWNDLMASNSVRTNPFGLTFDLQDYSATYTVPAIAGDSLLSGPYGRPTEVKWTGGTTMTLNTSANATVRGDAFRFSTASTNVLVAHGYYGRGRFAAMGDSSPTDDDTGDPGDGLYDGWILDAGGSHRKLIMNTTIWLAGGTRHALAVDDVATESRISVYPNPTDGKIHIKSPEAGVLELSNISGLKVYEIAVERDAITYIDASTWSAGIYIYRMTCSGGVVTGKIIKN